MIHVLGKHPSVVPLLVSKLMLREHIDHLRSLQPVCLMQCSVPVYVFRIQGLFVTLQIGWDVSE